MFTSMKKFYNYRGMYFLIQANKNNLLSKLIIVSKCWVHILLCCCDSIDYQFLN
jgi:hypothetical protein